MLFLLMVLLGVRWFRVFEGFDGCRVDKGLAAALPESVRLLRVWSRVASVNPDGCHRILFSNRISPRQSTSPSFIRLGHIVSVLLLRGCANSAHSLWSVPYRSLLAFGWGGFGVGNTRLLIPHPNQPNAFNLHLAYSHLLHRVFLHNPLQNHFIS